MALVNKSLAACVNIMPKVTSVFKWEGKVKKEEEMMLVIKSQKKLFDKINAVVHEHHPSEIPEVISMEMKQSSYKYY